MYTYARKMQSEYISVIALVTIVTSPPPIVCKICSNPSARCYRSESIKMINENNGRLLCIVSLQED